MREFISFPHVRSRDIEDLTCGKELKCAADIEDLTCGKELKCAVCRAF